jgi:hypothetical protein
MPGITVMLMAHSHGASEKLISPRGLEKPPQMDFYDRTIDPDEHIENTEAVFTDRSVQGAVKCKLFVTTLRRGVVTWFKNLRRNSIDS